MDNTIYDFEPPPPPNIFRYTIPHDSETKFKIQQLTGIKIMHMNIRGISKNFDEFLLFLESIGSNIDVLVLTEAHLSENTNLPVLANYLSLSAQGKMTKNEGVVVYYRNIYQCDIIESNPIQECTSLLVKIKKEAWAMNILAIYRTPSVRDPTVFVDSLVEVAGRIELSSILGDINICIKKENHSHGDYYLDALLGLGFLPAIEDYTRVHEDSKSCLDHFFIAESVYRKPNTEITSFVIQVNITDHYIQLVNIQQNIQIVSNGNRNSMQQIKYEIDYDKLNEELGNETWNNVLCEVTTNESYESFISTFLSHLQRNTHEKQMPQRAAEKKLKPWMTNYLLKCIRYRDHLFKQSKNNRYDTLLKSTAKSYSNHLKNLIKARKTEYYKSKLENAGVNLRKRWEVINEYTNRKKAKTPIYALKINDQTINAENEPITVATAFNDFFTNNGKCLAESIINRTGENESLEHFPLSANSIFLIPTWTQEVEQIIKELSNSKSYGEDGITTETIKKTAENIKIPLTHIINNMLSTGIFPNKLKKSTITPIYKAGDKQIVSNYRPITILPNFSKIFEKIIYIRIETFVQRHNILSQNQFGFQKKKSTNDAILSTVQTIIKAKEEKQQCLTIFLDQKSAFDTIPHSRLLLKLNKLGIRGIAGELLKSYLTERTQCTTVNQVQSSSLTITYGCGQGTVLAPLLFNLYINDLLQLSALHGKIAAFADDARLICVAPTQELLYKQANEDFKLMRKWLSDNLLTLNLDKTNYIDFSYNKHNTLHDNNNIDGITKCETTKYLGVIMDSKLNWKAHTEHLKKKLRKTIYTFVLLRNITTPQVLKSIYYALVESQIKYGILAWGAAYQNELTKISLVQKKILKIMHRFPTRYDSISLFSTAEVMTVTQMFQRESAIEIYKKRHSLQNIDHRHSTRYTTNSTRYYVPTPRTTQAKRQAEYVGLNLFNELDESTKTARCIGEFRKKLKHQIMLIGPTLP